MATSQKTTNRWLVFSSAWVIIFLVASIAIFSVFSEPMTTLHGWSSADYNLAYSLYTLIFAIVAIFAGMITDKFGVKWLMYVGGLLFGLGWFLTGSVTTIPMLYLTFSLIAGSGAGMMYNSALVTAMRWFPDKGGKISGLLLSSAAIGPFILSPVAAIIIEQYGVLNAFRILGVVFTIGIWVVGWLLDSAPTNYRPKGWTPPAADQQKSPVSTIDLNWKQMLKTPLFYLLFLTLVAASTAGTMMVSSASVIAQDQVGLTATIGAVIVSISTLSNFVGRLSFGVIYDKFGSYIALLINDDFSTINDDNSHVYGFLYYLYYHSRVFFRRITCCIPSAYKSILWSEKLWHELRHCIFRILWRRICWPAHCFLFQRNDWKLYNCVCFSRCLNSDRYSACRSYPIY